MRPTCFCRCLALCLCTAFLCLALIGCQSQASSTALSLVLTMTAAEPNCPAGDIYVLPHAISLHTLTPLSGEENIRVRMADDALLYAAFGHSHDLPTAETRTVWECSDALVDDGAMRLSTAASPCEFAVLHCNSRSDTDEVAALLLRRLDVLRRQYRGSDEEVLLARAQVVVIGKYVLLVISSAPEHIIETVKRTLT